MLVLKIVNRQLVQVAFADQLAGQAVLLNRAANKQLARQCLRTLVQSSAQSQKITNANNQQLIPVARNISFRQCQHSERSHTHRHTATGATAPYSISAGRSGAQFISVDQLDSYIDDVHTTEAGQRSSAQSPLEALKKAAQDVRERRELQAKQTYYGQSFNEAMAATTSDRRLVVLLSWLEAKEKHIEKYRQFYLKRGFDVLNVKTSPLDLLLPNRGARKISEDFVRFMVEKQYSDVVLHGFSVGGYMFGRFLLEIDRKPAALRQQLLHSIKGLVFDSLVPIEGAPVGVARSLTDNPVLSKVIENAIQLYMKFAHNIATKHYLEASKKVWGGPLRCPSLFLMSRDDKISDHRIVERLASGWTDKGIECHKMLFESSPHVQLYTVYHDQYVDRVDSFLRHIKVVPETSVV